MLHLPSVPLSVLLRLLPTGKVVYTVFGLHYICILTAHLHSKPAQILFTFNASFVHIFISRMDQMIMLNVNGCCS